MNQENIRIGFLAVSDNRDNATQRGAILVTDGFTHPIEMRYTEPVKVTTLEKLSFGLRLREGVSISRIAIPLVKNLETQLDYIVVGEKDLIRLEKFVDIPVVHTEIDSDDPEPNGGGGVENNGRAPAFQELRSLIPEDIDLAEPLQRIVNILEHLYYNQQDEEEI